MEKKIEVGSMVVWNPIIVSDRGGLYNVGAVENGFATLVKDGHFVAAVPFEQVATIDMVKDFCDGSCLDHEDDKCYCIKQCPYKEAWAKIRKNEI